jgi:DNA polymerase-3 subunit delta'
MSFENIIGNQLVKQHLANLIKTNQISGSYIFSGKDGIGKKLFAIEFSKMLLCQNLRDFVVCNCCEDCLNINKDLHPCLTLIKVRPGAKNISIEDTRLMEDRLRFKPANRDYKVAIIDEAERMSQEAMNSLLKILEEPPSYAVIILITSAMQHLFSTIISRCRIIRFQDVEFKQIKDFIKSKFPEIKQDEVDLITLFANGSIATAVDLVQRYSLNGLSIANFLGSTVSKIYEGSVDDIVTYYSKGQRLQELREEAKKIISMFTMIVYEILKAKCQKRLPELGYIAESEFCKKLLKMDEEEIAQLILELFEEQKYINYNVNIAVVLEDMFLRLRR